MIERGDVPQYNTAFDSQRFVALMAQRGTVGFESRVARENTYIRTQLRTDLGERLHVTKSEFVYEIREGKLCDPGRDEPMEDVIRRGNERNPIDRERDEAELASFTGVVQGLLADAETPDGTTVLVVSPKGRPGSFEQKNYFRVFVREGDYVLGTSYFSDLSNSDYREKILSINPAYSELLPDMPTDIDLKSTPVIIPRHLDYSADPDKLAAFILDDKKIGIPHEQLEQVWIDVAPLATSFINTLVERPWAIYEVEEGYQVFLGGAYVSNEHHKAKPPPTETGETIFASHMRGGIIFSGTPMEIKMLAAESKKIDGGACGSGSCSIDSSSVAEALGLEPDIHGKRAFNCPDCGVLNIRWVKDQLLSNCQQCNSDKVLPANLRLASFQPGLSKTQ